MNFTPLSRNKINRADRLNGVSYDIRGPVMQKALEMEAQGTKIIKLNLGNPAPFNFFVPDSLISSMTKNLKESSGYSNSKGILSAREAIMAYAQRKKIPVNTPEDILIGNGVSELILMTMQSLLNPGDEILVPSPDYPLWTASVRLSSGVAVHYLCDEMSNWSPNIEDIKNKISDKTRGIVLINPNNPTGAIYTYEDLLAIADLARRHDLMIFSDEIYDQIIFDDHHHYSIASLAPDLLCLTFNGLSKNYRAAGYRSGWCILSGDKQYAQDFINGLMTLASMRLCANVPAQHIIQEALEHEHSIKCLVDKNGKLCRQRNITYSMLNAIPGISCVKPQGALYAFPRLNLNHFNIQSGQDMALDILEEKHVLIVHGTGFNWHRHDHFRIVFLPEEDILIEALTKIGDFF